MIMIAATAEATRRRTTTTGLLGARPGTTRGGMREVGNGSDLFLKFLLVAAGVAGAVLVKCGFVNLCDLDESAPFVGFCLIPNGVGVVKQLDRVDLYNIGVVGTNDALQRIQHKLLAVVNVRGFGDVSGSRCRQVEGFRHRIENEMLLWMGEEELDADKDGLAGGGVKGSIGFGHCCLESRSKGLFVGLAGVPQPDFLVVCFGGCKGSCLGTRNSFNSAFERGLMMSRLELHHGVLVK